MKKSQSLHDKDKVLQKEAASIQSLDFNDPAFRRFLIMMDWPADRLLLFHQLKRAYIEVYGMQNVCLIGQRAQSKS